MAVLSDEQIAEIRKRHERALADIQNNFGAAYSTRITQDSYSIHADRAALLAHIAAQPKVPASSGWEPISTVPDRDDLLWFCRGNTYAGPVVPCGDEADYWDWWCYANPPPLPE